MSSGNRYPDAAQRAVASWYYDSLREAKKVIRDGEVGARAAFLGALHSAVACSLPLTPPYAEIVDRETLEPLHPVGPGAVQALAAFCGEARLIDNVEVD